MAATLSIFIAFLLLILRSTDACGISVYWEMYGLGISDLRGACDSGLYQYVVATFPTPGGDSSKAQSDRPRPTPEDIRYCQSLGIKVLMSLGGRIGLRGDRHSIADLDKEARESAEILWNMFLSGSDESVNRPFGDVIFDGIDINKFALPRPDDRELYYYYLATALKNYTTPERKVYLTASPHCVFPDRDFDLSVRVGLFDFVALQFYNNKECDYSGGVGNVLSAWNEWVPWVSRAGSKLFMSLAAFPSPSTFSGFIPSKVLVDQILPVIKESPAYGGVSLFSLYLDQISGYGTRISPALCNGTSSSHVEYREPLMSQVV